MTSDLDGALRLFKFALNYSIYAGNFAEIRWQREAKLEEITEADVLRETAWVILCSGFRERIVRRVFDHISLCFCDWESASAIVEAGPICREAAMASFRNHAKLSAIVACASHIHALGFAPFKQALLTSPITELRRLSYIGPVTVWHLAKNLGLDVVKPDRHLVRISHSLGFEDTNHFCTEIARTTGECKKVVDLIIWRYLADNAHPLLATNKVAEVGLHECRVASNPGRVRQAHQIDTISSGLKVRLLSQNRIWREPTPNDWEGRLRVGAGGRVGSFR
jgi:hypothetical protein